MSLDSTTNDGSLWNLVGPALQIGAGLAGNLAGAGQAAGGFNTAAGTIGGAMGTSAGYLSPYASTGTASEAALARMFGIGGGTPNYSAFYNSPGYQFAQQQGDQAIQRAANAQGSGFSATTLGALDNYNSGLASQNYQQYLANLFGLTQVGASSAGTLGSQQIQGATAQGNAQSSAGVASGVGTAGALGSLASGAGTIAKLFGSANSSGVASGDPSIGTYANNAATDTSNYINDNMTVQPFDPSVYANPQ